MATKSVKELYFELNAKLGPAFATAFKVAGEQVNALARKMQATSATGRALQERAQQVAGKFDKLETQSRRVTGAIARLNEEYNKGSMDTVQYVTRLKELESELHRVGRAQAYAAKAERLKGKRAGVASARNAAAVNVMHQGAMLYGLAQPIKDAMKFEEEMADVRKVVNFKTPQQFAQMSKDVLELSKRLPMTAEGIARIVAAGGQAGIAREDLMQFAEQAGKMGIAFNISADDAGQMMAKWRTAFKMNQDQVGTLADQINYLGNNTAAAAPAISDVVTRIGPLASVGGLAARDVAALGASVVGAGVESERASTGIKNLMLALTAGESATASQAKAFQMLGLDAVEVSKHMQKDAKGAIMDVLKALKGLNKEQQATALTELFGKESVAAIAPLLTNLEGLEKNFHDVADAQIYAGSVQKEYEAKCQTAANNIQLFKNNVTALSTEIGYALLPVVTKIVGGLTHFMTWVDKLNQRIPGLSTVIYGGAVAVIGFTVAFSALTWAVNVWRGVILGARIAWALMHASTIAQTAVTVAQTAAQWALNAAMAVGLLPILAIAAGIAALIAVGYLLYKNWDTVSAFVATCWEGGKKAVYDFCDNIRRKIAAVTDWIASKWEWIKSIFSSPIKATVQASASGNGQRRHKRLASGGIFDKGEFLTTFAEEGPEAAIPLDGSPRAVNLWEQSGRMMGLIGNKPAGGNVTATFAPVITVNGPADPKDITRALDDKFEEFKRMLKRATAERGRLSYE